MADRDADPAAEMAAPEQAADGDGQAGVLLGPLDGARRPDAAEEDAEANAFTAGRERAGAGGWAEAPGRPGDVLVPVVDGTATTPPATSSVPTAPCSFRSIPPATLPAAPPDRGHQ